MRRPLRRLPLLAALALAPAAAPAQQADTHAIVGARVITVSGPVWDRATVVMRDGLITAVGPDLVPPPGARVIDGKGLVVTPGLIDALSAVGLPAPVRAGGGPGGGTGGGAAGGAAGAPPAPLAPQALALDRVRAADVAKARDSGVTTALVIAREGVVPGQSAILNLAGDKPEAMVLRQPAALHLHMATLARQYPGSLMGTMAYVRQALLDAARARDAWAAWEKAPRGQKRPRYDASLVPWQQALAGRLPLVVTCTLENDVRRALALADEFPGLKLVLAGVPQGFRAAELLKARRLPLLVSVNFDPARAGGGFFGFDEEHERRKIQDAERNPAELAKAGVPFALASAWAPDFVAGIRRAVEKGLPAETALRAATLGAAEALSLAETTGSLEPGKLANVVAWSGEPFAKDTKARLVFVDGKLFEVEEETERKDGGRRAGATAGGTAGAAGDATKAEKPADEPLPPLPVSPPSFPAGQTIAITGGTLLTVGSQGDIPNGTLLIKDGRITAVGRELAVPAGAVVIDARGRFVMPGIIDSHSHSALEGGVNECTDVITAETRVRDVIDHRDVSIYRELAGGVTAINVLHGSCNAIGGQNAVLKLRWGKTPEELVFKEAPRGIKFALGENVKRSNFRAPGEPRYPGSRMGVEVVLREGFLRARAYKKEWADYQAQLKALPAKAEKPVPPRRDLRLETLADILDGKILVHAHGYRADEMLMLMSVADEFGFKVRTFQHGLEAYKIASEIAKHGAGVGTFIDWWAYKVEAWSAIPYNPTVLAAKGVKVSLNSDSDELARRLYADAAKAVKYGVSEAEALRMITWNPAWQLGVERYVGSLETGKQADVAIFSAHPLAPGARCEMTLVDGQVYFDRAADLRARLAVAEWAPLAPDRGGLAPQAGSGPGAAPAAEGGVR
jgi:imidazolonepropionase-like amidohydrolase